MTQPLTREERNAVEERTAQIRTARRLRLERMGTDHAAQCAKVFDQTTQDILDLNHESIHGGEVVEATEMPPVRLTVHAATPYEPPGASTRRSSVGARCTLDLGEALKQTLRAQGTSVMPEGAYIDRIELNGVVNHTGHVVTLKAEHNCTEIGTCRHAAEVADSRSYLAIAHPGQQASYPGRVIYNAKDDRFVNDAFFRKYAPLAHAGNFDGTTVDIPNSVQVEYSSRAALCVQGPKGGGDLFADLMHQNPDLFQSDVKVQTTEAIGADHARIFNIRMHKDDFGAVMKAAVENARRPIEAHVFRLASAPKMQFTLAPLMPVQEKAGGMDSERVASGAAAWAQPHAVDERGHVGFDLDVYVKCL